jgi:hypothetical protein
MKLDLNLAIRRLAHPHEVVATRAHEAFAARAHEFEHSVALLFGEDLDDETEKREESAESEEDGARRATASSVRWTH